MNRSFYMCWHIVYICNSARHLLLRKEGKEAVFHLNAL